MIELLWYIYNRKGNQWGMTLNNRLPNKRFINVMEAFAVSRYKLIKDMEESVVAWEIPVQQVLLLLKIFMIDR